MSLLYRTNETADLNHRDHGFILVIICMALSLVLASIVFANRRRCWNHELSDVRCWR
jgi:hypothetical protein